jgi:type I restriction enzyme S subunit
MTNDRIWPVRRLKYVSTINDDVFAEDTDPDHEILYIDIGNVDSNGNIHDIATYKFETAPSRARRKVINGDVIISTVRTYLEAIAPISDPPENLCVSTGFAVIRPRLELLDPGFCKYALRERSFINEVVARSTGISYPAINATDLSDIAIRVPPLETQKQIASLLDKATATLDLLVNEKLKLLRLLAEKRRTLIANAVTRGLNPDVPMRDSGIDWLGQIPSHWQTESTRWLFKEIDERSEDGSEELLTVSHLTGVTKRSEKDVNMFLAESNEGYKRCRAGDLVINTLWAWMGAMGVTPHDGIVSPAYNVYRPAQAFDPDYLDLLVRTPLFVTEITRYSKGVWSSRMRLYPEGLFEASMPVPPLAEQTQIVQEIAHQIRHIDALISATKDTVELLEERRTALIARAVTGQE